MAETGYTSNLHIKQYNQSEIANETSGLDWTLSINGSNSDSMANIVDKFAGEIKGNVETLKSNSVQIVKVNNEPVTKSNNSVNIRVPTKLSELTNDSGFIDGIEYATTSDILNLFS